jgi:hypothetical protein
MYDLWFTLGSTVLNPNLVDGPDGKGGIKALADFEFVSRVVTDYKPKKPVTRIGPSTGLLISGPTTSVWRFITDNVPGAAPVSIYTAGRFCQLVMIPKFKSKDKKTTFRFIMDTAKKASDAAKCDIAKSADFPALMGLCLLDGELVARIRASANPDVDLDKILAGFDVNRNNTNKDWEKIQSFVDASNNDFKTAAGLLMSSDGDMNPWDEDGTTIEQAIFWEGKSEFSIP